MPDTNTTGSRPDRSTKWFVIGPVVALGGLLTFLAGMADEMRFLGPSGAVLVGAFGALATAGFAAMALGPIGRAVGKRLLEAGTVVDPLAEGELHELRLQFEDLRNSLADTQERLDFTERMLASGKERATEELH